MSSNSGVATQLFFPTEEERIIMEAGDVTLANKSSRYLTPGKTQSFKPAVTSTPEPMMSPSVGDALVKKYILKVRSRHRALMPSSISVEFLIQCIAVGHISLRPRTVGTTDLTEVRALL